MVPSFYSEETPPGEVDVYNMLSQAPQDWLCIHSLDIAPLIKSKYANTRREIDFIFIIPNTGILCIEVKSHKHIGYDGVRWSPQSIKQSPFSQSSSASCAFFNALKYVAPEFGRVPVLHCCIFPNANFDLMKNLSVQPYELMDRRAFRGISTGEILAIELKKMLEEGIRASSVISAMRGNLSARDMNRLLKLCQPLCKIKPSPREEIEHRVVENDLLLRHQQKPVLQLAKLNHRVVVNGGAGTGKTLIAICLAQELANQGYRVGFFCFNRLVGKWIQSQVQENVVAGPINSVLAKYANIEIPKEPSKEFWHELPSLVADYCTDTYTDDVRFFDYIILDEAQDILAKTNWFESLDYCLDGGFRKGKFIFFGDLSNQVLNGATNLEQNLQQLESEASPTKWYLSENCRNYQIVGNAAVKLSGLIDNPYTGYVKTEQVPTAYDIDTYDTNNTQVDKIITLVHHFLKLGYRQSEITLLTFSAIEYSSISPYELKKMFKNLTVDKGEEPIQLESVYTYKGMENKIVILFDVELVDVVQKRNLFYTGITRATESIRILVAEQSIDILANWMSN